MAVMSGGEALVKSLVKEDVEVVFGIPGMGRFFVIALFGRDYSVIMGAILLLATLVVIANTLVDVAYAWLDPRIRYD